MLHSASPKTFPLIFLLSILDGLLFFPLLSYAEIEYEQLELPLWIQDKLHKDYIPVQIPFDDPNNQYELYLLDSGMLVQALSPLVNEKTREKLQTLKPTPLVTFSQLTEIGLDAAFDDENVGIRVLIPVALRALQRHSLRQSIIVDKSKVQLSNPFSANLSFFIQQSWHNNQPAPLSANLEGIVNWKNWTLYQPASYLDGREREPSWKRGQTQLIRRWYEKTLQLGIGDITYPRHGLMGSYPLSGLTLARNFELEPNKIAYPLAGQSFFLEEDAKVSVFVNGSLRHQLKLSAGQHEITDLPLAEGINQLVLEIEDRFGQRKILDFTKKQSKQLLASGLSEYAATLGVRRYNLQYESDNLAFSGFYRRGLSPSVTLGGHLEMDKTLVMGGVMGGWNNQLGFIDYDIALSSFKDDGGGSGGEGEGSLVDWAMQFGYQYHNHSWAMDSHFSWQGEQFATLSQTPFLDNQRWSASVNFSPPRLGQWALNYSWHTRQRWSGEMVRRQRVSLIRHFGTNWSLQLLWSHNEEEGKEDGEEEKIKAQDVALQISWSPNQRRWRSQLDFTTKDQQSRYELAYTRQQELGLNATATHIRSEKQRTNRFETDYTNSYMETRLNVEQGKLIKTGAGNYHQQVLTLKSALVYVGGRWALSRPLNGQPFALITTDNDLCGGEIQIKRGFSAQTANVLRHPDEHLVLPRLNAYQINPIKLDGSALPFGIGLAKNEIDLFPRASGGTLLTVKTNRAGYLLGTLLLPSGKPVNYQAGTVRRVDAPEIAITDFFTDDTGYFEIESPGSGTYILKRYEYQAQITVPPFRCEEIEVELGKIQLHEVK